MKALPWLTMFALVAACGQPAAKDSTTNNVATNNTTATNGSNNSSGTNGSNNSTGTNSSNNSTSTTGSNNTYRPARCTFDADCPDGEACEARACMPTCADVSQCPARETCDEGLNTEFSVCSGNESPNNDAGVYYTVMIQSTTTAPDACATDEPGPDIFGVTLENAGGETVGWGKARWDGVPVDANANNDISILDTRDPGLSSGNCPAAFDGSVISLGCDGSDSFIVVSFVDAAGKPVALNEADDTVLRIYEWGEQCTPGTIEDTYGVLICRNSREARAGVLESCDVPVVASASGESSAVVGAF